MSTKKIDVASLCLLSKLNIDECAKARIEAELCEFADFAAVLDNFAVHDMGVDGVSAVELRADEATNQPSELSGSYVTVPLTVKGAHDDR